MKSDQFAEVTRSVISKQGFENFQPTVCFPERRQIRALAGVPDTESQETATRRWAAKLANASEEYLIAYKCSSTEFAVVHFSPTGEDIQIYTASA